MVDDAGRERLLDRVWSRLRRFEVDQDPDTVLGQETAAEVADLLRQTTDPATDLEVAYAAGMAHWLRYLVRPSGDGRPDLTAAVELLAPVYRASPDAVPEQVRGHLAAQENADDVTLTALRAGALLRDALDAGDPDALGPAIDLLRQVLAAIPAVHSERVALASNLASALLARFERTGRRDDLDESVSMYRTVLDLPTDDGDRVSLLSNLAAALRIRFERFGVRSDLDEAVAACAAAARSVPAVHPERAAMMSTLAAVRLIRFRQAGDPADLDAAVEASAAAVAGTSTDHPQRAVRLAVFSAVAQTRFAGTGRRGDIDDAVTACREAVAATAAAPGRPHRAGYLTNLGIALRVRFERFGDPADADAAVSACHDGVEAAAPAASDLATHLYQLGRARYARFERSGDELDLDAAVDAARRAVAETPSGDPTRADRTVFLSTALRARFRRTHAVADVEEVIALGREALATGQRRGSASYAHLCALAVALHVRFTLTGDRSDLDEAITVDRAALAMIPGDGPDRAERLSSLAIGLHTRFTRTGADSDLDESIVRSREAARAGSSAAVASRAGYLSNFGGVLRSRFERFRETHDIDEAIEAVREALVSAPPDHPDRAAMSASLGTALQSRFEHGGTLADLDEAIVALGEAVASAPFGHPWHGAALSALSLALYRRYDQTREVEDLARAVVASRAAAAAELTSPLARIWATWRWAYVAAEGRLWTEAVEGFASAISLLSRVAPRSLVRDDQEHQLAELAGLGSDAAACCVRIGLAERAVELHEQGRGVLLSQTLETRTDLTGLAERHPELADRFRLLREELDGIDGAANGADASGSAEPTPSTGVGGNAYRAGSAGQDAEQRRRTAKAFDDLVAHIRQLPDFGQFLCSPALTELLPPPGSGPVVVISVSSFGSYAMILTAESGLLEPVELDGLTPETVYRRVVDFLDARERTVSTVSQVRAAEEQLSGTLGWLWDTIAGPVLDRLGVADPPRAGDPWPRLWWCVSGLLSFLPLHAAGHHGTRLLPRPSTVMDRVMSSYTPTVRALSYTRRGAGGARPGRRGQLVAVAVESTPGQYDLPGARVELDAITRRFAGRVELLDGRLGTRDVVLAALADADWAHFACHAYSDPDSPSASRLLVADDLGPLTVTDVARLRLTRAQLAFLSACSTARPHAPLADEAIHLASAFQLAGYRHVIGTLWPVADRRSVAIAEDIYDALADGESADRAPIALHHAVRRLRDAWTDNPSVWAAHVHVGA